MRYVGKALTVIHAGLCVVRLGIVGLSLVSLSILSARGAAAQETTIHNFGPVTGPDGSMPGVGLIIDAKGDLFGTTSFGGIYPGGIVFGYNGGTAYELNPIAGGGWTETVIHDFSSVDGSPSSALILDVQGNLYGTTQNGGPNEEGTVFKLSRVSSGSWTFTTIFSFGSYATDGTFPFGNLTLDAAGNLYGTTSYGGTNGESKPGQGNDGQDKGDGTVFELVRSSAGRWTEKVLYNFGATSADGFTPEAGLIIDSVGNLYGTTYAGGVYGSGTVFQLASQRESSWTETILHNFNSAGGDGAAPVANLILDSIGNLYGTTFYGGNNNGGTVFELSPASWGAWTERVLSLYTNSGSASMPYAGVTIDANGNLYGTASAGGVYSTDPYRGGTVFEVSPKPDGSWIETTLHSFPATVYDGNVPAGGVIFGSDGHLYGTTEKGGTENGGTVFEIAGAATPIVGTTTALVASPNANLVAGEAITLTATVTPASGTAIPAGTVTFADPSVPGGRATKPLSGGVAVYTGRVPPAGTYSVFASYSGSVGFYSSASATITKTVTAAPE